MKRLSPAAAVGPIWRTRAAALEADAVAARAFFLVAVSWATVDARRANRISFAVRRGWLTALAVSLSAVRG